MASMSGESTGFLPAIFRLFGTAFLRYRFPLNLWAVVLVVVNAASAAFLGTTGGRGVFVAAVLAATTMTLIYRRLGFVRLLGIAHAYWVPMLPWLALRLEGMPGGTLKRWLFLLVLADSFSLLMDAVDIVRYVRGERRPVLRW